MKRLIRIAILSLLSLTTNQVFAHNKYFRTPYVGVEVIQTNQNYKTGFGNGVFKKNPQDYNAFIGFRFTHYVGIEAGYEYQPRRGKNVTLGAGQMLPGSSPINAGENYVVNSNIRGTHPYLGVFAECQQKRSWLGNMKYQALVAASFSYIHAVDVVEEFIVNGQVINESLSTTYKTSKVVPMVKLSATRTFSNNVGIRISVDYRNLGAFKITALSGGRNNAELKLKDTFGIGLGLLYSFC